MTSRCLVLRNAAQVRERFFLPFHFEKRNGTGLRTSSLRSKRNDEGNPAAWVCSVSFVPGFFRSEFFPRHHRENFRHHHQKVFPDHESTNQPHSALQGGYVCVNKGGSALFPSSYADKKPPL